MHILPDEIHRLGALYIDMLQCGTRALKKAAVPERCKYERSKMAVLTEVYSILLRTFTALNHCIHSDSMGRQT